MKPNNKNARLSRTIIVVILTFIIGGLTNWFKTAAAEAVQNSTRSEMEEVVTQMQLQLESVIAEGRRGLNLLSKYVTDANITIESAAEFFQNQSHVEEFYNLYYVTPDGSGVSIHNTEYIFTESELFIQALKSEFCISNPHLSEYNNTLAFDIAVPVFHEDTVTAVLLSEVRLENFFEILRSVTKGQGEAFIINHDFNRVFSTSYAKANTSILEVELREKNPERIKEIQSDIQQGKNGSFFYDDDAGNNIMVYIPISMTNWTLAVSVETALINSGLVHAVGMLSIMCDIIYWFLIGLICYTSYYYLRSTKALEKTAYYDPLTELPNLAKLKIDMHHVLHHNKGKEYTIIVYDIENFKAVNEIFGYEIGDRILKGMKTLKVALAEPTLMISRIHDDKFAMFAGNHFLDDFDELTRKRIAHYAKEVPEAYYYHGIFKCGRYHIPKGETDVDAILMKVALAHKTAKETKGLIACDYDEKFRSQLKRESEITAKMHPAIENNEFKVFLQPKFSVKDNKLIGAEALVRWIEDDGTVIFPNDFIPLFERNGFIVELDKYILEKVCVTLQDWMGAGSKNLVVSVNCSRLNLKSKLFVENIITIVDKYNIPHEYIEIELTESTATQYEDRIEKLFFDLRNAGFKISIDDFGAGYSSLGMLKNLKADTIKLDRSFFAGNEESLRGDYVVERFIELSHDLDMYVVAEGIETLEQVETLRKMNCDAVQGYVHSKPISIYDFEEKYKVITR